MAGNNASTTDNLTAGSQNATFSQVTDRLNEIAQQVKSKDISLEKCLDLLEEAVSLGDRAVELVDSPQYSPTESARLEELEQADKTSSSKDSVHGEAVDVDG